MTSFKQAFWSFFHSKDQSKILFDENKIIRAEFNLENIKCIESEMRLDLLWKHHESSLQGNAEVLEQLVLFKAVERV